MQNPDGTIKEYPADDIERLKKMFNDEDQEWENFHDGIIYDTDRRALSPSQAWTVWRMGLAAWVAFSETNGDKP